MKSFATLAATTDRCAQCHSMRMDHCTQLDENVCRKVHHAFVEPPIVQMTPEQRRAAHESRIKAIEFDIACLQRGLNGHLRNAKAIRDLKRALKEYRRQLDE